MSADNEAPEAFDLAEYQLLKRFYELWEDLHAIPIGPMNRRKKEATAARLVETAHILRRMNVKIEVAH